MEPLEGPPVSSQDPAIIASVDQHASSSTHAVSDMLASSPSVMTQTPQVLGIDPDNEPTRYGRDLCTADSCTAVRP